MVFTSCPFVTQIMWYINFVWWIIVCGQILTMPIHGLAQTCITTKTTDDSHIKAGATWYCMLRYFFLYIQPLFSPFRSPSIKWCTNSQYGTETIHASTIRSRQHKSWLKSMQLAGSLPEADRIPSNWCSKHRLFPIVIITPSVVIHAARCGIAPCSCQVYYYFDIDGYGLLLCWWENM